MFRFALSDNTIPNANTLGGIFVRRKRFQIWSFFISFRQPETVSKRYQKYTRQSAGLTKQLLTAHS
ncbi:MAG: hypothetical protein IJR44_01785 [Neisseriaceae bacterium]|nr:hypothetical protein [Neisseriaceae bacterium]